MKINRIFVIAIVAIVGLNTVLVQTASANKSVDYVVNTTTQSLTPSFVEGEVLVKTVSVGADKSAYSDYVSSVHDLESSMIADLDSGANWNLMKSSDGRTTDQLMAELGNNPDVIRVERNFHRAGSLVPNDPEYPYQKPVFDFGGATPAYFELSQMAQSETWIVQIDSGINFAESEFIGKIVEGLGYDFVNGDSDPTDDNGHGTRVAGLMVSRTHNDDKVASFAGLANVKVLPIKMLDSDNHGTSAWLVASLNLTNELAKTHPEVRVVNASIVGGGESYAERDQLAELAINDVVVSISAGNDANNNDVTPSYPGAWAKDLPILTVGAASADRIAGFSNFGAKSVTMFAPSGNYTVGLDGSVVSSSGTSTSCAFVSAVAGVICSLRPDMDARQVSYQITATATPKQFLEGNCKTGATLNAELALSSLLQAPEPDVLNILKIKWVSGNGGTLVIRVTSSDPNATITVVGYNPTIKVKSGVKILKLKGFGIRPAQGTLNVWLLSSSWGVANVTAMK
jgi:subtilisin family serine protease